MNELSKSFGTRNEMVDYLKETFPEAYQISSEVSDTRGGRQAALTSLDNIRPERYGATRNFLDGSVTRLSPYLRHGILSLDEVRNFALENSTDKKRINKFLYELAMREYYQHIYREIGSRIWQDQEAYKTGYDTNQYRTVMPEDVLAAQTGMKCIDGFVKELYSTGYLHNHVRMYLASYLVHWRKVSWQAGAKWFLQHLLDGDPSSNNLSWQWVASTFSNKPYFFNRGNLEKYSKGVYCNDCPLYGSCDLEGSYEELAEKLFDNISEKISSPKLPVNLELDYPEEVSSDSKVLVWVHGDNLNPVSPVFTKYPESKALWIWDKNYQQDPPISFKRVVFIYESLLELPVEITSGDTQELLATRAKEIGATKIATMDSPCPEFNSVRRKLESKGMSFEVLKEEPLLKAYGQFDMKRFSRFWKRVEKYAYLPGS